MFIISSQCFIDFAFQFWFQIRQDFKWIVVLIDNTFSFLKIVSGDDDLPKRDDIGERRRKHELRVLAGAGIEPMDDDEDGICTVDVDKDANMDDNDSGTEESEDEFYKQVKQLRAAKLAAKEEIYSRYLSALCLKWKKLESSDWYIPVRLICCVHLHIPNWNSISSTRLLCMYVFMISIISYFAMSFCKWENKFLFGNCFQKQFSNL